MRKTLPSVLTVALNVHMTTRGSAERDPKEQELDILVLREVEHTWKPTYKDGKSIDFDNAVLHLVRVTIHEAGHALTSEVYGLEDD